MNEYQYFDYFVLVSDGDGHDYAVPPEKVEEVQNIFEKEWDEWTDSEQELIDSLKQIDGDDYYIVLRTDVHH